MPTQADPLGRLQRGTHPFGIQHCRSSMRPRLDQTEWVRATRHAQGYGRQTSCLES
jgi:hypothetical protein